MFRCVWGAAEPYVCKERRLVRALDRIGTYSASKRSAVIRDAFELIPQSDGVRSAAMRGLLVHMRIAMDGTLDDVTALNESIARVPDDLMPRLLHETVLATWTITFDVPNMAICAALERILKWDEKNDSKVAMMAMQAALPCLLAYYGRRHGPPVQTARDHIRSILLGSSDHMMLSVVLTSFIDYCEEGFANALIKRVFIDVMREVHNRLIAGHGHGHGHGTVDDVSQDNVRRGNALLVVAMRSNCDVLDMRNIDDVFNRMFIKYVPEVLTCILRRIRTTTFDTVWSRDVYMGLLRRMHDEGGRESVLSLAFLDEHVRSASFIGDLDMVLTACPSIAECSIVPNTFINWSLHKTARWVCSALSRRTVDMIAQLLKAVSKHHVSTVVVIDENVVQNALNIASSLRAEFPATAPVVEQFLLETVTSSSCYRAR